MTVLAKRTRIKTEYGNVSSTTRDNRSGFETIDANTNYLASGSIHIQAQSIIPMFSAKAKDILYKVYNFGKLKTNWDGNEAIAPTEDVIRNVVSFLTLGNENDLPIYFTAPGPNGEIVLEYKNEENTAEVFFEDNNFSEMFLYTGKKMVYSGEVQMSNLIQHLSTY